MPLRLPSPTLRLVFGLAAPAIVLVGSLVAVGLGGCTTEEAAPKAAVTGRGPTVEGHATRAMVSFAKDSWSRDIQSARTLSDTASFLPVVPRRFEIDDLLPGSGVPGAVGAYAGLCPPDMASIDDRFCVDRFEASLVEVLADGAEQPFSPYESVEGHVVRAVSEAGVYPQGYISEVQAIQACALSGKRLCRAKEWKQACMGPERKTYGYGDKGETGRCNDHGRSPMTALYAGENLGPREKWDWDRMNRPELNQVPGTLAHTGEHDGCTNGYGVYDMVGNLHEWVDDPNGTFQGGYYQDTTINGEGCQYVTMAHEARYHDYSTGFRCCADVAP